MISPGHPFRLAICVELTYATLYYVLVRLEFKTVRPRLKNLPWRCSQMPLARILTRNPERTADFSRQLKQQGYSVEWCVRVKPNWPLLIWK